MNLPVRLFILFFFALLNLHPHSQQLIKQVHGISSDSSVNQKHDYLKLIVRNAPSLTVQLIMNYDYGVFELSGNDNGDLNADEFINGKNFGVRHGIGAELSAKYPLHKSGNLRLTGSLMYNKFTSKFNKVLVNNKEQDFVKYDVYSVVIGIEDNFNPGLKIRAFTGLGFTGSIITGNSRISSTKGISDYNIKPAFRLGLNVYSGFEYLVTKNLGLSFGLKFTHANLWLKESKADINPGEIYLNDQKVSNGQLYSGYRQFAWGSFEIGFNYYIGVMEKVYYYRK